ncbi:hypothetical protein SO802_029766 [Lithocarpus litseifolius]|uniref:Uncharacterized protein n=1 Tax=Lithocarpus litseifolius TaxID=425828 RepID=A0AAW2BW49_9ROSI
MAIQDQPHPQPTVSEVNKLLQGSNVMHLRQSTRRRRRRVEEDRDVAEEGEENLISGQYHEASDYFDESSSSIQIASPYPLGSWSYQDNQVGDDSDQVTSTSPHQHLPSQPYYQDSQQNSSATNPYSIVSFTLYPIGSLNINSLRFCQ